MNRKAIVTIVVAAVLMAGIIAAAVVTYNYLSEEAPADSALRPPVIQGGTSNTSGGQSGGTETTPPGEQTGGNEKPAGGTENGEETPGTDGTSATDGEDDGRRLAADFTVQDSERYEVNLSDFRGKPVVLNFWASWCPPCMFEMPDFDEVYKELGGDVHFMMVCMVDGARETVKTGSAFIAENGYSFPVYFDADQSAARAYAIRSLPTTVFIDADGYVVTWAEGAITEASLRLGISYIFDEITN